MATSGAMDASPFRGAPFRTRISRLRGNQLLAILKTIAEKKALDDTIKRKSRKPSRLSRSALLADVEEAGESAAKAPAVPVKDQDGAAAKTDASAAKPEDPSAKKKKRR